MCGCVVLSGVYTTVDHLVDHLHGVSPGSPPGVSPGRPPSVLPGSPPGVSPGRPPGVLGGTLCIRAHCTVQ